MLCSCGNLSPLALQDELFPDPFSSPLHNQTAVSHLNKDSPRLWPSNKCCSLSGTFTLGIFLSFHVFFCPPRPSQQFSFHPLSLCTFVNVIHTHTVLYLPPLLCARMWSQSLCTQKLFPCRPQRMQLLLFNLCITVMSSHNLPETRAPSWPTILYSRFSLALCGHQPNSVTVVPCTEPDFSRKNVMSS